MSPWVLTWDYAELGDKEQTLAKLDDAYKEGSPWIVFLQKAPPFDFLHKEPRYRALVKKIGLAPIY